MIRKLILLLTILFLTACQFNKVEKETDFDQNPKIESAIYKEHFFAKEFLDAGEMKVDRVDQKTVFEGAKLPVRTEKFPKPYYVTYVFDTEEEILDLAFLLTEGMVADGKELPEAIFVYLEYANANNEILTLTQENTSGDDVGYVGLFEEEWEGLAEEYIQFVEAMD